MTLVRFEPLDSLFFRDGRPYHKEETNQAGVVSMFPPAPSTLVGAIRAACARALSWKEGKWSEEICKRLGDGDDLGPLRFHRPILIREANREMNSLFPVPAHLMGKIENSKLTPGSLVPLSPASPSDAVTCDLDENTLLPVVAAERPENAKLKLLHEKGWWITAEGLELVLQGKLPEERYLFHQNKLWSQEPRVGIARSEDKRTTEEGAMYSPSHIRLAKDVSLAMEVDGLPQECIKALPAKLHPVGGESRACWLHLYERLLPFPKLPELQSSDETLRYMVVVLTPADVSCPPRPGDQNYVGLPGQIVSACLPRPVMIGGWNSVAHQPQPLRPHLAPGSVLFLKAKTEDIERIEKLHNTAIGKRSEQGFGLIAIGLWNDQRKHNS